MSAGGYWEDVHAGRAVALQRPDASPGPDVQRPGREGHRGRDATFEGRRAVQTWNGAGEACVTPSR
jgi:hypothetical protein